MVEKIFLQEFPCMAKQSTKTNRPEKPDENNSNSRNHLKKTSSQHLEFVTNTSDVISENYKCDKKGNGKNYLAANKLHTLKLKV